MPAQLPDCLLGLIGKMNHLSSLKLCVLLPLLQCSKAPCYGQYISQHQTDKETILPGWYEAPSSLADYPLKSGKITIDPWCYLDRLGLYKIILNATNDLMPMQDKSSLSSSQNGDENFNFKNILWGLPVQFSWQYESGRLQDFANASRCGKNMKPWVVGNARQVDACSDGRVYSRSWWARMNYYLSVIPFLGAVNAGLIVPLHPLQIAYPQFDPHDFCTSIEQCYQHSPDALNDWTILFQQLMVRKPDSDSTHSYFAPTFSPRVNTITELMWTAHVTSLHSVIESFGEVLSYMPKSEQKLGLAWANLVDYIAATR